MLHVLDASAILALMQSEPGAEVVDALLEHEKDEDAKQALLKLVDVAAEKKDVDLASEVVERMSRLLKMNPKRTDKDALREKVEQLARVLDAP